MKWNESIYGIKYGNKAFTIEDSANDWRCILKRESKYLISSTLFITAHITTPSPQRTYSIKPQDYLDAEVGGLVALVVCPRSSKVRQQVKGQHTVRLGVLDRLELRSRPCLCSHRHKGTRAHRYYNAVTLQSIALLILTDGHGMRKWSVITINLISKINHRMHNTLALLGTVLRNVHGSRPLSR